MKAFVPNYQLVMPESLQDALNLLSKSSHHKLMAGGTDLMVLFERGQLPEGNYLSLQKIYELKGFDVFKDKLIIKSGTTFDEIMAHEIVAKEFPMLKLAADVTGAKAIQNRGTLGGNIANASPAADSPVALLCYDTSLTLESLAGKREIPYEKFHLGYKKVDLRPNEIITEIKLKRNTKGRKQYYQKVGTREAQSISKVCFAASSVFHKFSIEEIQIAFGSIAPTPYRAYEVEKMLVGKYLNSKTIADAVECLKDHIHPMDDIRSTKEYRQTVAGNLLQDYLEKLSCGTGQKHYFL